MNHLKILLRAWLAVLFAVTFHLASSAQTQHNPYWSVYTQGGLSWTKGAWFENVNAKQSYGLSPALGGGVDYTIRPWLRAGVEYIWSDYRREQRPAALDAGSFLGKAYGSYKANYHNAKLGVGLNILEFWPAREARWLNVWAGTGVGYSFGRANEYSLWFENTVSQNGQVRPITADIVIDNASATTITGRVRSTNRKEAFNRCFIPASLHVEADVNPQLTVGLKGECDWILNRRFTAPKNYLFALATVRYNFVPGKAKVLKQRYEGEMSALNSRLADLSKDAAAAREQAERSEKERLQLQEEVAELHRALADCENEAAVTHAGDERITYVVFFAHNSSYLDADEAERLHAFAQAFRGCRLSLLAEASTPGSREYNQALSERRLARVIDLLKGDGFSLDDLVPGYAIGEQNGIDTAEGRRVTITVESIQNDKNQ